MRSPSPSLDWDNWSQCWSLIYPPAGFGFSWKLPSVAVHNFYFLAQFPLLLSPQILEGFCVTKVEFQDLNPLSGQTSSGLTLTSPGTFWGAFAAPQAQRKALLIQENGSIQSFRLILSFNAALRVRSDHWAQRVLAGQSLACLSLCQTSLTAVLVLKFLPPKWDSGPAFCRQLCQICQYL